jgi:hypothetical protein
MCMCVCLYKNNTTHKEIMQPCHFEILVYSLPLLGLLLTLGLCVQHIEYNIFIVGSTCCIIGCMLFMLAFTMYTKRSKTNTEDYQKENDLQSNSNVYDVYFFVLYAASVVVCMGFTVVYLITDSMTGPVPTAIYTLTSLLTTSICAYLLVCFKMLLYKNASSHKCLFNFIHVIITCVFVIIAIWTQGYAGTIAACVIWAVITAMTTIVPEISNNLCIKKVTKEFGQHCRHTV